MISEDLLRDCEQAIWKLQGADFWTFACASVLLWYIGRHIAGSDPRRQRLGWQVAYLSFLGYCVGAYFYQEPLTGELLIAIVVRGVLFGGAAGGIAWSASPLLLTFFTILHGAIRALKRWIAVPGNVLTRRMQTLKSRQQAAISKQRAEEHAEKARKDREEEARRNRAENDAYRIREEQRRAAELHLVAVRHSCELAYNKYRPGIASRWPENKFKKYLDAYLLSSFPKEVLDRHAEDIKKVIDHHAERLTDERELFGTRSIDELHACMDEQRKHVRAMNISPDMAEELICEIDQAFQERARSIIGKL